MNRGFFALALLVSSLWPTDGRATKVSVLIDLDPNSATQTVIVESLAAVDQLVIVGHLALELFLGERHAIVEVEVTSPR